VEWAERADDLLRADICWFTDGSKSSKGTGAGAFCAKVGVCLTEGLGQTPTVLQAELYSIKICSREMMNKNPPTEIDKNLHRQ